MLVGGGFLFIGKNIRAQRESIWERLHNSRAHLRVGSGQQEAAEKLRWCTQR